MNVFEGARRVAMVVAGLGVAVALFSAGTREPYVTISYAIPVLTGEPRRVESCEYNTVDARKSITRKTKDGREYNVELCFRSTQMPDGSRLVPYKFDGQMVLLNTPYSPDVLQYTNAYAERFTPPPSEDAEASSALDAERWRDWKELGNNTVLSLLAFWAFVALIGWVVRGFLGIPFGQDRKPV